MKDMFDNLRQTVRKLLASGRNSLVRFDISVNSIFAVR